MNYDKYAVEFKKEALEYGWLEQEVDELLEYAQKLYSKSLPIIYDQEHLSKLLGVDLDYLYPITNASYKFYRRFNIQRKNGKKRIIDEPFPILKEIQHWILNEILLKCECSIYTKAFKKNSSIKENAKFHRNQNIIINLDIKDYFGSIKEYQIYCFFIELGYNEPVAMMLTKLCSNNNSLPQGAPTSPYLSNILTRQLDNKLVDLSNKYQLRYTRYADDITFSTKNNIDINHLIRDVKSILWEEGFYLNQNKTRVTTLNKRQMVTGIVVNKKLQVSKEKRKENRKALYYIKKFGIDSHMETIKWKKDKKAYMYHLLGNINFVLFINPKDKEHLIYKQEIMDIINGI